ncbi:ABC transporter permease [Roseivirga sp. E12]|uniref:ABC transporter permease n=1 Tax=Roseivirga sp. E12 TaxID=2819237 RepID=UPI001ABC4F6A|nr:ABC transporter permease [Roseivirga sp. E12]MBO3698140.1 ABC transporter permease [Roseivirga sp. E12]
MLSKGQVNHITRIVKKRGIKNFSMEEELIDYVSCEVEERVASGEPFDNALSEVIESIPMGSNSTNRELEKLSKTSSMDMIQSYLKVALRNFSRYKINSAINIFGLTISLTACIIIGLYLKYEHSFDKHYPEVDRLYRINTISNLGQTPAHITSASWNLIPAIQEDIPEVEASSNVTLTIINQPLKWKEKAFFDYQLSGVTADFPIMIGLKSIMGDVQNAFSNLNTVILSESRALMIFGEADPIGESIEISMSGKELKLEVVGVYEDLPTNTHFGYGDWTKFSLLVSRETSLGITNNTPSWSSINGSSYVRLNKGTSAKEVAQKINELVVRRNGGEIWYEHYLQPISDIHLNKNEYGIESKGNLGQLRLFVLIGIIIVVIACINYVNLTTAQASVRLKEVGIRKVIGARRRQFIVQFLVEATMTSLLSMVLALVFVLLLIPFLNANFSLGLSLGLTGDFLNMLGFLVLVLVVSLLCGAYPGWYLSKIKTNILLKTGSSARSGGGFFRKVLVALQYATSITLIVATLIITDQMRFMSQKDLGFNKEQVVYIPLDNRISAKYGNLLYTEFIKESGVVAASLTGNSLGDGGMGGNGVLVGDETTAQMLQVLAVDDDFKETLGLEMKEGRWFSNNYKTDREEGFVVNEAFVKHYGLESPIGLPLSRNGQKGKILGVVRDYHFKSMHNEIEPLVMHENDRNQWGYWSIAVRLAPDNTSQTLNQLEDTWSAVVPEFPFEYEFLDQKIDQYYKSDQYFAAVFRVFSSMAIVVSCLGLIGLVTFTAQRRTKEIGVRKVLGASVGGILRLLSQDYLKLILVAAFVSIPVAYLAMESWLENFQYRVGVRPYVFVLGLLITLLLSWLSVGYLSLKAAKSNPAEALRME